MNILITGVGGADSRGMARVLRTSKNSSGPHRLIGADCSRLAVGLYAAGLFDAAYLVPRAEAPGYWETIEEIVDAEGIDIALIQPEDEVEAWARHQQTGPLPCTALVPSLALVRVCRDKASAAAILAPEDLAPWTFRLHRSGIVSRASPIGDVMFPCWMRAAHGAGGRASLKVNSLQDIRNWAELNSKVDSFTLSAYLPGRNLACKVLFYEGELLRAACAERLSYIMAHAAPSGVTGNTSFGRLINDRKAIEVAERALRSLARHVDVELTGFFTVDLKEDASGEPKVTEVNIRHVAFTAVFAAGGANLIEDTITLLSTGRDGLGEPRAYEFTRDFVFLRDVDVEPVVLEEGDLLEETGVRSGSSTRRLEDFGAGVASRAAASDPARAAEVRAPSSAGSSGA